MYNTFNLSVLDIQKTCKKKKKKKILNLTLRGYKKN